jgi:polyhydroxybutyrate depolymerase
VGIRSFGQERTYALFVPLDYDGRAYPVVFAFHGDGGTGAGLRDALALEAPANGAAIFVYPDATEASGRSFDLETPLAANADMQLFIDIVDALESTYQIDRGRVFAAGLSRGAFFANFLNCRLGEASLRAIAAHSGSGPYGPASEYDEEGHFMCAARSVAALMIHGTADAIVPLNDALYTRGQWTWANGCADDTIEQPPEPCVVHEGCAAAKPVVWCAVDGLGHEVWSEAPLAIWSFFASLL